MLRPALVRLLPQSIPKFSCGEAEDHPNDLRVNDVIGSLDGSDERVPGRHFMRWQVTQTPKRFLLRGSLLSLCLAACCVCGTRPAWATCGDYLAGHGDQAMAGHGLRGHGLRGDDSMASHRSNDSEQRPACSGPHCRQRDPVPAAPTRTVNLPQSSDAILCAIARLIVGDETSLLRATSADHVVDGPADSIFRPPRAA